MSDKIRSIIIGCGGFCRYNIPSIVSHPDFQIVVVVDPLEVNRLEVAKMAKLSKDQAFPTDREALKKTSAEMAFIFSPVEAHYENCRIALENGCYVSVAKPFVASLDQALDLIKLSKETQRWISVGQTARLGAFSQIVKKLLNKEIIGKPAFGNFYSYRNRMQSLHDYSYHERWPVINATTIHQFDQCRYLFNEEICRVCFRGIDVPWNPYDDPGVISGWLEMESGFVFSFFKSFVSQVVLDPNHHPYEHGMIQGDRGAIFWEGPWGKGPIKIHHSEANQVECLSQEKKYEINQLDLLRDSLLKGKEVFCPAEDNIWSLAAIKSVELSASQGGTVVDVLEFSRLSGLSKSSNSQT